MLLINAGKHYGLVLADYRLSGTSNGLELLSKIAARRPEPVPKAALVTGDFDPVLLTLAHARNVPILHKPLSATSLRAILGLDEQAGLTTNMHRRLQRQFDDGLGIRQQYCPRGSVSSNALAGDLRSLSGAHGPQSKFARFRWCDSSPG